MRLAARECRFGSGYSLFVFTFSTLRLAQAGSRRANPPSESGESLRLGDVRRDKRRAPSYSPQAAVRQPAENDLGLVGRERERARIDALLNEAADGQSGALVITGEPGIGKSALLRYALSRVDGTTHLSARGAESESELAFASLADFVRPVLDNLSRIPSAQAAALSGALGLGPPAAGDRFVICAATLSLLDSAAERRPLLGIVDDAHWLDTSSAQAIVFTARRLGTEGIVLLLASPAIEGTVLERAGIEELQLSGLEEEAARELLAQRTQEIAPQVVERLVAETAGNPLALLELSELLSADQLTGAEPLAGSLPPATTVERLFAHRVGELPESTQQALLVLAASESGRLADLAPALHELGLDVADLDPAEQARLVTSHDETIDFRHPLLRSAVYNAAGTGARRAAHRALAEEASRDRRAWHLSAAAPEREDDVADALETSALASRKRGGHAEAAAAFERAAELTTDGERRARRLVSAADESRIAGGGDHALRLLDGALESTDDAQLVAEIQHLRGTVEMWRGEPAEAYAVLVHGAEAVEPIDPSKAARMLADAAWASFMAGEINDGLEVARRACAVAERAEELTQVLAGATLGLALLLRGETDDALPLLVRYQELLDEGEHGSRAYHLLRPAGQVLTWLERYEGAEALFQQTIASARENSALGALPYALAGLANVDFRTGQWVTAYAGASEAVRIAEDTDQRTLLAFALISLSRVEAALGRADDCRAHVARALECSSVGAIAALASSILGFLELGLGRAEEAIAALSGLAQDVRNRGLEEPNVIQWAPELIEAYVRVGRTKDAERELEFLARQAEQTGRKWALATAARCRVLLVPDDEIDTAFAEAIALWDETTPFPRARTQLCYGERLRRARRRADAREPLLAALEVFERLRAVPWIERAASELAATGVAASVRDPIEAEQLTPQELQVALVVAKGATNREAGAALFLSPKTIETHLSRVYRKLDVRSRTELANLVTSGGVAALST